MIFVLQGLLCSMGIIFYVRQRFPAYLFGGGGHRFEGTYARLLAGLLILPLPTTFVMDWLLIARLGEVGADYRYITDIVTLVGVLVLGIMFSRILAEADKVDELTRQAPAKKPKKMSQIHAMSIIKTGGALTYAVLSVSPLAALFAAPVAIIYGSQALQLIKQDAAAARNRGPARAARIGGVIMAVLWLGALVYMRLVPPA